eukprot:CAMPEP_0198213116 /NCGR_PEP_ID=MMETSP1445-20131203/28683_1 /TAXON_ID=36898 /ORGANISM="Pyramimonas sp., Strain CCMP2087" /LENGTH=196 /DNA_ID=CAMNT_0043887715 /DNA_START=80 /DNA_END=670 /DNA_ORIENTATION=+
MTVSSKLYGLNHYLATLNVRRSATSPQHRRGPLRSARGNKSACVSRASDGVRLKSCGTDEFDIIRKSAGIIASTALLFSSCLNAEAAEGNQEWAGTRWPIAADAGGRGVAAQYSGVDDDKSEYIQGLLKRTEEHREEYAQERLDRFYNREWMINKIAAKMGMGEVLPEPCDPRDIEFTRKCTPGLPRLPQGRAEYP